MSPQTKKSKVKRWLPDSIVQMPVDLAVPENSYPPESSVMETNKFVLLSIF